MIVDGHIYMNQGVGWSCVELKTGEERWFGRGPGKGSIIYADGMLYCLGEKGRMYVLFGDLGLWCYDFDGKLLWRRKIEPKKTEFDYGAAASPVVHDGQVIVIYDNLETSWIAAFDAKTGNERWRTPREETRAWATPLVWENSVRTEIVVAGENRNRGYSLDGELLWEFDGDMGKLVITAKRSTTNNDFVRAVPSPRRLSRSMDGCFV